MIVYKATNIINNKVYIGKTIRDIGHAKARLYYIYRNTREKLSKAKRMYTEEQAKSITKLRDIDKLTFKDIAERLGFKTHPQFTEYISDTSNMRQSRPQQVGIYIPAVVRL